MFFSAPSAKTSAPSAVKSSHAKYDFEAGKLTSQEIVNQFLHQCLRGRLDTAALRSARALARKSGFDWDVLSQVVNSENLAPLLYQIVRDQDIVPATVEQSWNQAYIHNAARNTVLFHELEAVVRELNSKGLPVVLLKGAALVETIYGGNAAIRPMIDIDLLVRRESLPTALRVLSEYCSAPSQIEAYAKENIEAVRQVMFRKAGIVETLIDLHWSLLDSPFYPHRFFGDWAWETAKPALVGGTSVSILGCEALVLHLCAHLLIDQSEYQLLELHDIAEVVTRYESQIDWDLMFTKAQQFDLVSPLQEVLSRVMEDWDIMIPNDAREKLSALRASPAEAEFFTWLTRKNQPAVKLLSANLASMPSWRERLRYIWRSIFPKQSYMERYYRARHRWLVPLLYPYRWLRAIRSVLLFKRQKGTKDTNHRRPEPQSIHSI